MEGIQPPRVAILRVLSALSRGSIDWRGIHESETEAMGCDVVDDTTVNIRLVGFPVRSSLSPYDA